LFARHVFVPSIGAQNRQPDARNALRIGLLTSVRSNPDAASTERGVRLGADEAKQTANLFGSDVQLYEASAGNDALSNWMQVLPARTPPPPPPPDGVRIEALATLGFGAFVGFLFVIGVIAVVIVFLSRPEGSEMEPPPPEPPDRSPPPLRPP